MEFVIGLLINLLIIALVVVIVLWVLDIVVKALSMPPNVYGIIKAIIILIALLYFLGAIFGGAPVLYHYHRQL